MTETTYLFGCASRDMTPPVGIKLAGFAALTEPSTGVELPLRVSAFSFSDGEREALIISAEIVGFYDLAPGIRQRLSRELAIPVEAIALVATHTHAGPCLREMDRMMKGPLDDAYIARFIEAVVACAREAVGKRSRCHLRFSSTCFELAVSRRRPDGKGGVLWGPWDEGVKDPTLSILTAHDAASGELSGVLFSYACHPTSRATLEIGGDYVGFTYRAFDALYPGVPIGFLQGCAGDQKTRFVAETGAQFRPASSQELGQLGEKLASIIKKYFELGHGAFLKGELATISAAACLATVWPDRELHEEFQRSDDPAVRAWAEVFPWRADASPPPRQPMEVQAFSFGRSLGLIFLAGEISAGYALALRKQFRERLDAIIPIGYSNEMAGYIPTAVQIPEGGYEVWRARQNHKREGFFDTSIEKEILDTARSLFLA